MWLHESERVYSDRLATPQDQKKYKELALEQAKKYFKDLSPTSLMAEPLIFCHFASGVGDKVYDKASSWADMSSHLEGALAEYNETNPVMDLVLFEDAMRHVARISRIIESPGGHGLLVGVGGSGKQSLSKLATYVAGYTTFQARAPPGLLHPRLHRPAPCPLAPAPPGTPSLLRLTCRAAACSQIVISATYGVADLKADLQAMYRKCGLKNEGVSFLFTDAQITDERFLVYMNDLLASGNVPGLFPPDEQDEIINQVRPAAKRAGVADARDAVWAFFINQVKANLHVLLCFSPIGEPIRVRARRFPSLVNCVVIDWFQPWPEDALMSVSKKFLAELDLGADDAKATVIGFMPYSFLQVGAASKRYLEAERRHNYTTPKSFLELIFLYKSMLAKRRGETNTLIERYLPGSFRARSLMLLPLLPCCCCAAAAALLLPLLPCCCAAAACERLPHMAGTCTASRSSSRRRARWRCSRRT